MPVSERSGEQGSITTSVQSRALAVLTAMMPLVKCEQTNAATVWHYAHGLTIEMAFGEGGRVHWSLYLDDPENGPNG